MRGRSESGYVSLSLQAFKRWALRHFARCQWCGEPLSEATATADHLQPQIKGDGEERSNLCLACGPCNKKRGSRGSGSDRVKYGPANWEEVWQQEHARAAAPGKVPLGRRPLVLWIKLLGEPWKAVHRHGGHRLGEQHARDQLLGELKSLRRHLFGGQDATDQMDYVILREGEEP
jgi:hypothetical protein